MASMSMSIKLWENGHSLMPLNKASLEDAFKPNFLKISEGLADGQTFMSVCAAFEKLSKKEQNDVLNTVYRQNKLNTAHADAEKST